MIIPGYPVDLATITYGYRPTGFQSIPPKSSKKKKIWARNETKLIVSILNSGNVPSFSMGSHQFIRNRWPQTFHWHYYTNTWSCGQVAEGFSIDGRFPMNLMEDTSHWFQQRRRLTILERIKTRLTANAEGFTPSIPPMVGHLGKNPGASRSENPRPE